MIKVRPSRTSRPRSGRRDTARRRAGLLLTAVVPALIAIGPPAEAAAAPPAAGQATNATRLASATYPGVQLIETDFTATLSLPGITVDDAALKRLENRLILQLFSGLIDPKSSALLDAMVTEIEKNPLTYLKPDATKRTTQSSLSGFGTGWVATPDGYIVTAAHVINPDPAEIKQAFASSGLKAIVDEDSKGLMRELGGQYSNAELVKLAHAMGAFDTQYLTVDLGQKDVYVQRGVALAGFQKSQKGQKVEVVSVGEAYPGKDVAVLKLDGESHLPTLALGKNEDVAEGNILFVAGYPAASTFFSGLSKDSEVQPTITQGPLTAVKSNTSGTPIFQTQAPASPGNSGGPVLDEAGKVVGILVASAVSDQGVALENQEFVIPASVITEKLNQSNIHPTESDTTAIYNQALDAYDKHYYKQALPLFQKVSNLYPAHPYVQDFISQTQSAIDAGKDETPPGLVFYLIIGGVVLFVVLVLVGLILLLRRRTKTATGAAVQGQPGQFGQGYPPPGQPTQPPQSGQFAQPTGGYGPGYPPPGQPGYQGYPPPGQAGYQGYPPPGQAGYQGYPPPGQSGQSGQSGQPGYPPPGQPRPAGQPPVPHQGHAPAPAAWPAPTIPLGPVSEAEQAQPPSFPPPTGPAVEEAESRQQQPPQPPPSD